MEGDETMKDARVIDASQWLAKRVDGLIEAQKFEEAIGYLRMLFLGTADEEERRQSATYLGYLYLLVKDLDASRTWLEKAQELATGEDPHIKYALGYVAMGEGAYGMATVHFLEAFVEATQAHDEAEFLRSAALSLMQEVGPGAPVAAMLLGALDRDVGNPWVLDALVGVYAADQRWLESLEALSILAEVVQRAAQSMVVYRAPTTSQLLRNRLIGRAAQPEELHRRAREINEGVRRQFEVVLDARQRRGATGLTPLRFPEALSRLVKVLEERPRGVELVEAAQSLWARACFEGFEEILGPMRLAAAIHLLVERLHWREPSSPSWVAAVYGESRSSLEAAARVVAGRLKLRLFDGMVLKTAPNLNGRRRLENISQALLFGEGLEETRTGVIRLGS